MIYPYFIAIIMGYLFGSLPFAWIIVRLVTGKDVRDEGSGSVSTRNTVRTAGYFWAILTATLDVTKGFIGCFLLRYVIFPPANFPTLLYPDLLPALCGIAAFAGHCWMPWMKFRGGKGFAVLTGALIVVNPWCILVWWGIIPIWLVITRYSGISGILATTSVAVALSFFYGFQVTYWHEWSVLVFGWGCVVLVILRMIPDFIGMKKGEITRWKGIKVSQWMK